MFKTSNFRNQTQNLIWCCYQTFQAAHCLDDVTQIEVRMGVSTLFQTPQHQQLVQARDIRPHPQYNRDTLINDIGLIYVQQRIPFTNLVQPIALPSMSQENNRFVGDGATIIGWGKWGNEGEIFSWKFLSKLFKFFSIVSQSLSDSLRFINLPILPDRFCIEVYNQDYRFFNPSNICVSGARGSSCGGDSGSGQHVTINGQMTIIGLVSYGSATCDSGHPPVMTRITSYLDWITSNTGIRRTWTLWIILWHSLRIDESFEALKIGRVKVKRRECFRRWNRELTTEIKPKTNKPKQIFEPFSCLKHYRRSSFASRC
jgi:Trypsin